MVNADLCMGAVQQSSESSPMVVIVLSEERINCTDLLIYDHPYLINPNNSIRYYAPGIPTLSHT
jgi:hypothetical protein